MSFPLALNTVHQVDCIAAMQNLPAGSVDLAFADPPFNIGYDYDVYDDSKGYDEYLKWSQQWIAGVHRVLADDGSLWLAIGDEFAAELKVISRQVGFHCRSWVVWYYTFGVNCTRKFTRSHAHIFHLVKNPQQFTFNDEHIRVPSARMLVYGDARANPRGRLPDDTWILRPQDLPEGFQPDEDIWYFPRVAGTFKERAGYHGCQMPEQLLGRIVRVSSHPGQVVLDPFAGSGTTLIVAKKLARNFIGFDISPEYVERCQSRLTMTRPGDDLDGAAEPLLSAPSTSKGRTIKDLPAGLSSASRKPAATKGQILLPGECVPSMVEAFAASSSGYSADRVVADPVLNAQYVAACRERGLDLPVATLNQGLFRLRKRGRLSHISSPQRTSFSWSEYDRLLHGSEIAWELMVNRHHVGLDSILCDPALADEFDRLAAEWAPGFTPLHYRWGALKLRKLAHSSRRRAQDAPPHSPLVDWQLDEGTAEPRATGTAVDGPGLYLICGPLVQPLYVGQALQVRARARQASLIQAAAAVANIPAQDVQVRTLLLNPPPDVVGTGSFGAWLVAGQCRAAAQFQPRLNAALLSVV